VTLRAKGIAALVATAFIGSSGLLLRAQAPQAVGTWVPAGELAPSHSGAAAVALEDGRTLIVGGAGADGASTDRAVIVNPRDNSLITAGRLLRARVGHTATLLADGRVLVVGGTVDGAPSSDLEVLDLDTGGSTLVGALAQPRSGHAAARLADGTVLIAGGSTLDDVVLATAESFDPESGSVALLPSGLQSRRAGATATRLIDGRILVAGGNNGTTDLGTAEIYDPAAYTFTLIQTQLSVARSGHAAVLLPHNNSVLIAGGRSNGVAQTAVDLFLPAEFPDPYSYGTGTFAATGAMSNARAGAVGGPGHAEGFAFVTGGGSEDEERYRFATIKTDKDDYAPGERAVITGTGWQPGEDVRLVFQEDPAVHDDYVLTVTADENGNIYWDQWAPEEHDIGVRFYLMARDSRSRAQTTFTDGTLSAVTVQTRDATCSTAETTFAGGSSICAHANFVVSGSGATNVQIRWRNPSGEIVQINQRSPGFPNGTSGANSYSATFTATVAGVWTVLVCQGENSNLTLGGCQAGMEKASATFTVLTANRAPAVSFTTGPTTVNESGTTEHAYTLSITDPDSADSWTFTSGYPSCGTGGSLVPSSATINNSGRSGSFSCTFPDGPATPTVAVRIQDAAAATSNEATRLVAVTNVPPDVNAGAAATADEGSQFTQTGSFTDPGSADTWTATVNYGDGAGSTPLTLNPDKTFNLSHTYADNGTYAVIVTVTDDDGGAGTDTVSVIVKNVAPTVSAGPDGTLDEGSAFAQSGSFSDPGDVDTWTATVNYGDGAGSTPLTLNPDKTFNLSHTYADNGTYTITVTVTDDDGGSGTDTVSVTVKNVAPTVNAGVGAAVVSEGAAFAQNGSFMDPGTDTWAATVNYGDGSGTFALSLNPDKSFSLNHKYGDNGTFTVTVTVTDDDGGAGAGSVTVTVINVAPSQQPSTFLFNPYTGAASAGVSVYDPGWLDTVSSAFNWAGTSIPGAPAVIGPGSAPALTGAFTSSYTFAPGCVAGGISVTVADDDGGAASHSFAAPNTLQVYTVGFLAPIRDSVRNVVKHGNVIPVKLAIHDCNGNPVLDKTLSIAVYAGILNPGDDQAEEEIPTSVSAADSNGVMRLVDTHYMYNMSTKSLAVTLPYTIIVRDGGMVVATAVVETKK